MYSITNKNEENNYRYYSDNEILKQLKNEADINKAIEKIIKLAEKHGEDNASAIGVRIR